MWTSDAEPVCPLAPEIEFTGYPRHGDSEQAGANAHLRISSQSARFGRGELCPSLLWVRVFASPFSLWLCLGFREVPFVVRAQRRSPLTRATIHFGVEMFADGLSKRQGAVDRAALNLATARRSMEVPSVGSADELEARWPKLSQRERREIISSFIDCIFIQPGSEPIVKRAFVCRRGEAPIDLPRPGKPAGKRRRFSPRSNHCVRLRHGRRWSERRIRSELHEFLGDREAWPSYGEFAAAGRARLYYQVMRWGGPHYWAGALGVAVRGRIVYWSEERVRDALRPFLRNRTVWPSCKEFNEAGLSSVQRAAKRYRGMQFWAEEFGLGSA